MEKPLDVHDAIPLFAPNLEHEEDDELGFVGQGPIDDAGDTGMIEDLGHVEEEVYNAKLETSNYNKLADKQQFCQDWTRMTGSRFRADSKREDVPDDFVEEALPYEQLNSKQAVAVDYLRAKIPGILSGKDQFFLDISGSAGTGKTTIMKRFKADLSEALMGSSNLAVGKLIHFAAFSGCAAKLLPSPNSTLHKLLRLPIGQVRLLA